MTSLVYDASRTWSLPPLILHPFSDAAAPQKLVQSSRANLMLQGLLPMKAEESFDELQQVLIDGRYCEIRMLFFVGKDTSRWLEQCKEMVEREPALRSSGIEWQSFANLLVEHPPAAVLSKLKAWGVADHKSIFSRGLAFNAIFAEVPSREVLSSDFIRNYHQFCDQLFAFRMSGESFVRLNPSQFEFELFASGEYASHLARQWEAQEP